MTVLSANKVSVVASEDDDGNSTYVVTWRVITNSKDDGPRTCFSSGLLPAYGTTYVFGNDANVNAFYINYSKFRLEDDKVRIAWLVDITFSSKPIWNKPQTAFGVPTSEPWKIRGGFTDISKLTGLDKNNAAIMNSADELKVREVPSGHPVIHFEGYTANISLLMQSQAVKHCNSATIWGLSARKVFMRTWDYEIVYHNTTPYVHHVMEFEIDHNKWNEFFVDMGTRTKFTIGTSHIYTELVDTQDHKQRTEVHLNGLGAINDWTANPNGVLLTKEVIPEFDFTTIPGLPNPLPAVFV